MPVVFPEALFLVSGVHYARVLDWLEVPRN